MDRSAMIGKTIGPYQVVAKLGAGGMGDVYRVRDTRLNRDAAIKLLPDEFAKDHDRVARFTREAQALAALNHPNIAQVFGLEESGGVRAIAMEYVPGRTLDELGATVPADEALAMARQIASALEAAHDHGIVHRDLKPANIKIRDDDTIKVLDFGLAKSPGDAGGSDPAPTMTSPAMTAAGVILGTASYMSPEQARGRPVDRRADIWSFGVVVFELVTGRRLFIGDSVSDVVASVLRQDIPWERLPREAPRLRRLLERCLERDPQRRLRDAGDARLEIEDMLARRDEPATVATSAAPRSGVSRGLERAIWAAVVAAAAAIAWWVAKPAAPAPESWSRFTQVTDEAGAESTPAISPDGVAIAYASTTAGSWDIYVRRIGGRNATVVAADPARDEAGPAFSPDGRSIAFHEADGDGGIFVVGATGESVRRLTETGFHPAWSPDGKSIALCRERISHPYSRAITSALSIADVATGQIRVVTETDAAQPAFSPDGSRLVYWRQAAGRRDVYSIAVAGGDPVAITDDDATDWSPTWSRDGAWVYFASDRGGAMNLWRVPIDQASGRTRGLPEPVTAGVGGVLAWPTFSADGRKLAFVSQVLSVNPVRVPLNPQTFELGEPSYLLQRNGVLSPTSVSPDGQWLAYGTVGAPVEDILVSKIDGTDLRRLTDDTHRDRAPVWSPDGKTLAFYSNREGSYEIWTIKRDGSGLTRISHRPSSALWYPFYAPSGRQIWAHAPGQQGVILNLDAAIPQAGVDQPVIKVAGGFFRAHAMSSTGTRLVGVAMSPEGARIGVGWHDIRSGETWISPDDVAPGFPAWLPDGRRMIYAADNRTLVVIDTSVNTRRVIGRMPFDVIAIPAVAPDGRAVYLAAGTTESDVWLVETTKR